MEQFNEPCRPHFEKAWKRREYEASLSEQDREMRRMIDRKMPAPSKVKRQQISGDYFKPLNWTPEECKRLDQWRGESGVPSRGISRSGLRESGIRASGHIHY